MPITILLLRHSRPSLARGPAGVCFGKTGISHRLGGLDVREEEALRLVMEKEPRYRHVDSSMAGAKGVVERSAN